MQLVINDLFQYSQKPNSIVRVIWIDSENKFVFLIDVHNPKMPYSVELHTIESMIQDGELLKTDNEPFIISFEENHISTIEKEKRNNALEVINFIYVTPDIFYSKNRSALIKSASVKYGLTEKTIRKYLKRYWSRGMTRNALLPDYVNCGKSMSERKYSEKTGRPSIYPSEIKRGPVTDEWKRVFRMSLEKYYFMKSKPSLKHAYQQMLKQHFSIEDEESSLRVLKLNTPIPSFEQFRYWYRKWYRNNSHQVIFKREGQREYSKKFRSITGSATQDSLNIGVYAIDATVADIYLISSFNRKQVIGRPIIYLISDIFSRVIAGIGVSVDNVSTYPLRITLANTFGHKHDYCKQIGLEVPEEEWPISFIPHTLLADRGSELISDKLSQLVEDLQIKISNTGAYRAEMKSTVEKYFDIVQKNIQPFLPGSVDVDINKRGVKDYRKEAVLTLQEYTQILVRAVLYYNNHNFLQDYPLTKQMIAEEVPPIPIEIFKWSLKQGTGRLRSLTSDSIRSIVYPQDKALVTPKGIKFKNLYYSCEIAVKEHWFSTARINGNWEVTISFNEQNMDYIYLRMNHRSFEKCHLIQENFKGISLEELLHHRQEINKQHSLHEKEQLNSAMQLSEEIERVVSKAKQDAQKNISGVNTKDIKKNRKLEKERLKQTQSQKRESNDKVAKLHDHKNTVESDLELFRKKQKQREFKEDE